MVLAVSGALGRLLGQLLLWLLHVRHHLVLGLGLHLPHIVHIWWLSIGDGMVRGSMVAELVAWLGIHLLLLVRDGLSIGPCHQWTTHLLLAAERLRSHACGVHERLLTVVKLLVRSTLVPYSIG